MVDSPTNNDLQSSKAENVTAKNYADKAKAFMGPKEDFQCVVIDPQNEPQQWGAWFSYFGAIKRKQSQNRMKQIHREFTNFNIRQNPDDERKASLTYIVPAAFPSDFDASREWLDDKLAGDRFLDWFKAEKDKQASIAAISPEDRVRVVENATKGLNLKRNLDWRPGQ